MFCTICQEHFEEEEKSVTLSCGCMFHGQCIVDCMQRGVCSCPNCRQYHPKYLQETEDEEEEEDEPIVGRRRSSIRMLNIRTLLKRHRSIAKKNKKASKLLDLYNKYARRHRDAKKERKIVWTLYDGAVTMLERKSREDIKNYEKRRKEDLKVSLRSLRNSEMHKELMDKNRVCSMVGYRCRTPRKRMENFEK